MRKLSVFNNVTLDGFFSDAKGSTDFAHHSPADAELNQFVAENAGSGGTLIFGRKTYDIMASFWPTPQAAKMMPEVASGMNRVDKIVFSKRMKRAAWQNTTLIKTSPVAAIRKLKQGEGSDLVILGSGSIVSILADAGLIDQFQLMVNPVVLVKGRSMFQKMKKKLSLKLTATRTFKNGNVLLTYGRM